MKRLLSIFLIALLLYSMQPASAQQGTAISAPVLKWAYKGCYSSWCQTGWYSSPAVADLDGDGSMEVIGAAYSIFVLDGATGGEKWRMASGHQRGESGASDVGRTWPDVAVADLEGDGSLEIVTAHSGGWLAVYDNKGYFIKQGWPKQITPGSELRSLGLYDLEGDGDLEILAAATRSQDQWFAFEHNGALRAGSWPQHGPDSNTNGYTAGCYNQNLAAGDLDGDGRAEIVGPNDTHYLAAFQDDGSQVRASAIYGKNPDGSLKVWSRVGVHVDHAVDLRGYANCGSEHRPNFADSAPIITDLNRDGLVEAIVVGNVYNCGTSPYASLYQIPYILNGDRTRWKAGPYDWTSLPAPEPGSAPLSEDWNEIESSHPNPAAADLDGDGLLEILYPSYDGRMHAYWLDKTEHGAWPYAVKKAGESFIRFATEPVVADLDNNGQAEVIFASWTEKGSHQVGKLHILNAQGGVIHEVALPGAFGGGASWNGALAAPTLANIDGDADLEIVLNTAHSGLVAYDLPGTAFARVLWGTGRGSYLRSGSLSGTLDGSSMTAQPAAPAPGALVTYTTTLRSSGQGFSSVFLHNPLPSQLTLHGAPSASSGSVNGTGSLVTWNGSVQPGQPVTITYQARVSSAISGVVVISNTATVSADQGGEWSLTALVIVNGLSRHLPLITR